MRSPSARILKDTALIYPATFGQDKGGGLKPTYAASPSQSLACAAHPHGYGVSQEYGKEMQVRSWTLTFGQSPTVKPRDRIIVIMADGAHTLYAEASKDLAGRGAAWVVSCSEKV